MGSVQFLLTSFRVHFALQILIVLGAVLGTIIYRISVMASISGGGEVFLKTHAKIFTTMTAATINLIIIMILTRVSMHVDRNIAKCKYWSLMRFVPFPDLSQSCITINKYGKSTDAY